MDYYDFWQCSRTLYQLALLGMVLPVLVRDGWAGRCPSHRFGGDGMMNECLSLEPGYIPVRIRRRVLQRDRKRCVWCGEPEERRVSHFVQKRVGGETSYYNLVTTCEVCKRNRQYLSPSEFITKLALEKLDVFREVEIMRIKVIMANGEEIDGEVAELPDPETKAFYLTRSGNGTRELIYVERGMRIIELGGRGKK